MKQKDSYLLGEMYVNQVRKPLTESPLRIGDRGDEFEQAYDAGDTETLKSYKKDYDFEDSSKWKAFLQASYDEAMQSFRNVPVQARSYIIHLIVTACGKPLIDKVKQAGGSLDTPVTKKGVTDPDSEEGVGLVVKDLLTDILEKDPKLQEFKASGIKLNFAKGHLQHLGRNIAKALIRAKVLKYIRTGDGAGAEPAAKEQPDYSKLDTSKLPEMDW